MFIVTFLLNFYMTSLCKAWQIICMYMSLSWVNLVHCGRLNLAQSLSVDLPSCGLSPSSYTFCFYALLEVFLWPQKWKSSNFPYIIVLWLLCFRYFQTYVMRRFILPYLISCDSRHLQEIKRVTSQWSATLARCSCWVLRLCICFVCVHGKRWVVLIHFIIKKNSYGGTLFFVPVNIWEGVIYICI